MLKDSLKQKPEDHCNTAPDKVIKTYVGGTHASNGYPQHMFSWRNKKNIYFLDLIWSYAKKIPF